MKKLKIKNQKINCFVRTSINNLIYQFLSLLQVARMFFTIKIKILNFDF